MRLILLAILLTSCVPKFVNETPVIIKHKMPISTDTEDPQYLEVEAKYNSISDKVLIEKGKQYRVIYVDNLPKGTDGKTFPNTIQMRPGLNKRDNECIYAHELGHALGHWHHGTCNLMQPTVSCRKDLNTMIEEFYLKWIKENL